MQQDRQRRIRGLFEEYIQMYACRDERLTSCFSKNFTGFTGSWGRLIQDHDEWIRITRQDFAQVPAPIRIEAIDVSLQDLCNEVVLVAATLHIHLPGNADLLAKETTRLVLVFRQEAAAWMITHCSFSVPYQHAQEDEIYPLKSLQEQNITLKSMVAERTRELHENQAFYRMLTEDAVDVLWRMDRSYTLTYISPADERLRGFRADEVVGRPVFEMLTEAAGARVRAALQDGAPDDSSAGANQFSKLELEFRCKDGSLIWGEVLVKPDRNEQGEVVGYHGITRNVTERKRLEEQVRQLAYHDSLTRLANRRLLLEHLDQAMAASKRSRHYGALLYIDLDSFKPLNDTHGHGMGDLLLIEVASRLKGCVREADTVARIGGDEYVVLLCTLDTQAAAASAQANAVAEKIRTRLAERYVLRSDPAAAAVEHNCTASIGVALFLGRDESKDSLLERADQAMYQAKLAGRNRVQFAHPAIKHGC